MLAKVKEWEHSENSGLQSEFQNLSENLKANDARLEKLVSTYLDNNVSKEIYLKKKDEIMRASLALKEKKKDFENGRNNWVEPLRKWILDTKQADFLCKSDDLHAIKEFIQKIGTNHEFREKSARFAVPSPSDFIAVRRHIFPPSVPSALSPFPLSSDEGTCCARERSLSLASRRLRPPRAGHRLVCPAGHDSAVQVLTKEKQFSFFPGTKKYAKRIIFLCCARERT